MTDLLGAFIRVVQLDLLQIYINLLMAETTETPMYICGKCGEYTDKQRIKCPSCNTIGTIRFDNEQAEASPAPVAAIVHPLTPGHIPFPQPVLKKQLSPRISIVSVSSPSGSPPRVAPDSPKSPISPRASLSSSVLPSGPNTVLMRSAAGKQMANAVIETFKKDGLLVRSVQLKNCQCITADDIGFDSATREIPKGAYIDGYTYAHPSIAQLFFQLSPNGGERSGEGKRAMALLIDWRQNQDRYVDSSTTDMSANKQGLVGSKTREVQDCARDVAELQRALGDSKFHSHNEIRFIQVAKDSLVGLIWCPIDNPTPLSDGGQTWDIGSKDKFTRKVAEFKAAGAAKNGLPVFTYTLGAQMTLEYLDYIP